MAIELCRTDGDKVKFMEFVLTDVIVTSVIPNGYASGEALPVEEVSFAYGRIDWTYTELDPETGMPKGNSRRTGTLKQTWAVKILRLS